MDLLNSLTIALTVVVTVVVAVVVAGAGVVFLSKTPAAYKPETVTPPTTKIEIIAIKTLLNVESISFLFKNVKI